MNTERKKLIKIYTALFFCYAFLALLFPYTGDDWAWGSSIGMERLKIFFKDYNGRYAGNLIVMMLTRSKVLDALVMAASFLLVCHFSHAYSADKTSASLLLAAVLFFIMPKSVLVQAVVWTAGFTNYMLSALITVGYLLFIKEITGNEISPVKETPTHCAGMFILGFIGALFVESVTVFNICLAVASIFYMFLRFRTYRRAQVGFLLGSIIAAVIMFSNGAYDRVAQGVDYYRSTPADLQETICVAVEHAEEILDYMIYDNLLFSVIISGLLLILVLQCIKNGKCTLCGLLSAVLHVCSLLLICLKAPIVEKLEMRFVLEGLTKSLIPILFALLYGVSILILVLCVIEKGRRFRMLLPFYCIPVSLAPLLIVTPIGPRCVFLSYFFMIVFAADLFGYVRKQILPEEKWTGKLLGLVVALQLLFYYSIFYPIHYYDTLRLDYIKVQAAEGKQTVVISDLPNNEYLWNSLPCFGNLSERYKLFHNLDENLQFECITYQELKSLYK